MTQPQYPNAPTLAHEQVSSVSVTELLDRLAKLGSAEAVAAHLFAAGTFGTPRRAQKCPLSLYVARETGVRIYVNHTGWEVVDRLPTEGGDLPGPVAEFVWRFDCGRYPELDESQPDARGRFAGQVTE